MVTWEGKWRDSDRQAAQDAISAASIKLAELTGLAPDEAFYKLFGDITLEALPSVSGDIHGHVSALYPRRVQLEIGEITEALLWHELGHVLILTDPNDPNIADWLSCNVIRTASGRAVTGAGRGGYSRHMGYRATKYTGYASINYPAIYHPYNMDKYGNTPTEDFCGIWESLVKGNIADNEAGQALTAWLTEYLQRRLA